MGWLWFIPSFHMPQPPLGAAQQENRTKLVLTRKEIDFPLGIGSDIIDVEILMEWLKESDGEAVQPPARPREDRETVVSHSEPTGLATTMQAATADTLREVVEAKQAAED